MILFRAVFLELIVPFVMTLVVMTTLFMMEKVYRLVSLAVENRLNPGEVGLMLVYLVPKVLSITLPLAVVGGVFIVVIRQSMDSEVISLRATGRSLWSYSIPYLLFGFTIAAFAGAISLWLQPLAIQKYYQLQIEMVRWRAEQKLVPGAVNYDFGDKVILVGGRTEDGLLTNVFISNRVFKPDDAIISAQSGRIQVDETNRQVVFLLQEGEILTPQAEGGFNDIQFETLRYLLEYEPVSKVQKNRKAMLTNMELIEKIDKHGMRDYWGSTYALELMGRLTAPFACLALALSAIPMAILDPRSGKSASYMRAISLVVGYYVVWAGFRDLILERVVSPLALWIPVVLTFAYGLLRLWQLNSDNASLWRLIWPFHRRTA